MAVIHSPDSAFAKESVKWEAHYTPMGPPGRPFRYQDYPMHMHKAGRPEGGLGAPVIVETCEVTNEQERTAAAQKGFSEGPDAAVRHWHAQQREFATLAAERNFHEKRMSPKARAEAETANMNAVDHLPSVPETPLRHRVSRVTAPARRSHKKKAAPVEETP